MERRSHKTFNDLPRPIIYRKRPKAPSLKGKTPEEIKAALRLIADLQKVAANG